MMFRFDGRRKHVVVLSEYIAGKRGLPVTPLQHELGFQKRVARQAGVPQRSRSKRWKCRKMEFAILLRRTPMVCSICCNSKPPARHAVLSAYLHAVWKDPYPRLQLTEYAVSNNMRFKGQKLTRKDPIGPEFYVPLGTAAKASDATFYLAAALSVIVLLVDKTAQPKLYEAIQATFAVAVIGFFVIGIVVRTYFAARAHSGRIADFVSNAFSVPLVPSPSEGYYNTSAEDPFMRMGASVLENTLFTKSILAKMLRFERARIGIYVFVWLWAVLYRATDLELLTVAAQVLFSEQLLSRWVRMEWLRSRVERLYDDLYALIQSTSNKASKEFRARVVEALIRYEASKAQAGLSLSSRVFNRMNADLSLKWQSICSQLGIGLPTKGAGL